MMQFPIWLDQQAWQEYESMRRRIKKPLTELGATRLLNRCQELQAKGWDANEALLVAADCCWLSVYPPRDMQIPEKPRSGADQTQAWLRSLDEAKKAATKPPERLLRMVGKG